jgi:hypothetical protein
MTNYTVRVEPHDANDDDYEDLWRKEGFVRWIMGKDDNKYRLPTAEYNLRNSALTCSQVRDLAREVAKAVKANPVPWVLATESNSRRWIGLKAWKD